MPIAGLQFRRASTQEWVGPRERDPADEDGVRLLGTRWGDLEFLYDDIPGNSWTAARLKKAQDKINRALQVRVPLDDPSLAGDPAAESDPGLPNFYWDNGELVSFSAQIKNLSYSDEGGLYFEVTRG